MSTKNGNRPRTKEELKALRKLCSDQRKMLMSTMSTNVHLRAQILAACAGSHDKLMLITSVADEVMKLFGVDMKNVDQSYLADVKPLETPEPEQPTKRFTKQYGQN